MPIRPEYRKFYDREWTRVIRPRVLARAHYECELCRKPMHVWIYTYSWKTRDPQWAGHWHYHMIWIREGAKVWRNQYGRPCSPLSAKGLPRNLRVKLTVAHQDHNPANRADLNLRCWCTWCHLHFDQSKHKDTRAARKDGGRQLLAFMERGQAAQAGVDRILEEVTQ